MAESPSSMKAIRLHGPRDLRVDVVPRPGAPKAGEARVRVTAVGICGSDLHSYVDGRIGDSVALEPLIIGHEFAGVVEAVGADARDGNHVPLLAGSPVAVDPAQPCNVCPLCRQGHPNLCEKIRFMGLYPDQGALCESVLVPADTCFPVSRDMSAAAAVMLEPLGVAIHATDLANVRVGHSAAVLGAGPIGLLTLQMLRLAGADPVYVTDRLPWRLELAERLGGSPIHVGESAPVAAIVAKTGGRGVDRVVEAAFCDETAEQACEMARLGGRVVLVGISADDRLTFKHSTARRKGLTIALARRMKHAYPRAIELVERGRVDVECIVSHHFPMERAADAFQLNADYADGVNKVILDVPS